MRAMPIFQRASLATSLPDGGKIGSSSMRLNSRVADSLILATFNRKQARSQQLRICLLDVSETRPYMVQLRFYLLFQLPTFVAVDVAERFVLMCNYTGKEVV